MIKCFYLYYRFSQCSLDAIESTLQEMDNGYRDWCFVREEEEIVDNDEDDTRGNRFNYDKQLTCAVGHMA